MSFLGSGFWQPRGLHSLRSPVIQNIGEFFKGIRPQKVTSVYFSAPYRVWHRRTRESAPDPRRAARHPRRNTRLPLDPSRDPQAKPTASARGPRVTSTRSTREGETRFVRQRVPRERSRGEGAAGTATAHHGFPKGSTPEATLASGDQSTAPGRAEESGDHAVPMCKAVGSA